ncbi:hypothetical protein CBOM_00536 [Ceraceosorus bombacis]|uniref:Uncharacterized protein n=1 Tax=Ceraceosorus bombacis TaxID=401625 RepID=A0A0P1BAE1_9BASI|nr:hypothetical protein CBOM_00536 [Ceraceosorus bombacis]
MRSSTSSLLISAAVLGALCSSSVSAASDGVKVVYTIGRYGYPDIGSARAAWNDQCSASAKDKGTVSSNSLKAIKPTVGQGLCVYKDLVGAETDISEDVAGDLSWGNYHDAYNKGGDSSGNSGYSDDDNDDDNKGAEKPSPSSNNHDNGNAGGAQQTSNGQTAASSPSPTNNDGQGQQQQQQQQQDTASISGSALTASITSAGNDLGVTGSSSALNAGQTSAARRNNGPLPLFKLLAMLI